MCRHILLRQLKPGLSSIGTFTIIFFVVEVSRVSTVVTVATNATSVSESTCNVLTWLLRRGAHISPGLFTGLFLLIGYFTIMFFLIGYFTIMLITRVTVTAATTASKFKVHTSSQVSRRRCKAGNRIYSVEAHVT